MQEDDAGRNKVKEEEAGGRKQMAGIGNSSTDSERC
jgi:hypothetical protein